LIILRIIWNHPVDRIERILLHFGVVRERKPRFFTYWERASVQAREHHILYSKDTSEGNDTTDVFI
jgi:hypothetical protein